MFKAVSPHDSVSLTNNSIQQKEPPHTTAQKGKYEKDLCTSHPNFTFHDRSYGNGFYGNRQTRSLRFQRRGFIFLLPMERNYRYISKLISVLRLIAHGMYILHVLHLFPSDTANYLRPPPWRYETQTKKAPNRDYIIEPDWDS